MYICSAICRTHSKLLVQNNRVSSPETTVLLLYDETHCTANISTAKNSNIQKLKIQLFTCTIFLCSNFSMYFFHWLYLWCWDATKGAGKVMCTAFFCTSTVLQLYFFTVYNVLLVPNIIFNKMVEICTRNCWGPKVE